MRAICAGLLASSLIVSSAFAATTSVSSLAPGKPAGTQEAALLGPSGFLIFIGFGIIAGSLALGLSGSNNDGVTTPTTTSTSTTVTRGLP